jgi:putative ABC transport system ATP-binding protein
VTAVTAAAADSVSRDAAPTLATTPVPALMAFAAVHKVYGDGAAEVRALDGVDLAIGEGELVAIMGSSGSGKSTAMNILGALDRPTRGRYLFRGVDVAGFDRDQRALFRRHYLGFVFQSFNLLARTSALDNVLLPLTYQGVGRRERRERALAMLDLVGLADRAGHTPAQLSGGQQQRVAIARALVTNPAVILADEPTGNLDSARSAELMELFVSLNEVHGITVVMVTHEPEIATYLRRVLWFSDGRVLRDGPPEAVLP